MVAAAVDESTRRSGYGFGWGGASLYAGLAGSALLFRCAARAQPDRAGAWEKHSQQALAHAVRSTQDLPLTDPGLAAGTSGLALVLADSADDEPRYRGAAASLDARLAAQVVAQPPRRHLGGVRVDDYDVVSGTAGVLGHLVGATRTPATDQAVGVLVDQLVWLCGVAPAVPEAPWWIAPDDYPNQDYRADLPHGYVDLGLAHGIAGPLAALSLAVGAGHGGGPAREAVRRASSYLLAHRSDDDAGMNWAMGVPLDASQRELLRTAPPARTAWCYGAPGICSALLLAADALDDGELRGKAVEAFDAVLRRFLAHGEMASATLCHGTAGVLAVCAMVARRTGSPLAVRTLPVLVEHLLEHSDADLPLGVQDLEQPGVLLDSPGFLTGAAGVALALWTATTPVASRWQRALLVG